MKHLLTAVALAASFALPAMAQNLAIVNGKPVPLSRVDALAQQLERSGRPVTDEVKAQLKEEVIAREIFAQEAERRGIALAWRLVTVPGVGHSNGRMAASAAKVLFS